MQYCCSKGGGSRTWFRERRLVFPDVQERYLAITQARIEDNINTKRERLRVAEGVLIRGYKRKLKRHFWSVNKDGIKRLTGITEEVSTEPPNAYYCKYLAEEMKEQFDQVIRPKTIIDFGKGQRISI